VDNLEYYLGIDRISSFFITSNKSKWLKFFYLESS